jgi:hypothetical protein
VLMREDGALHLATTEVRLDELMVGNRSTRKCCGGKATHVPERRIRDTHRDCESTQCAWAPALAIQPDIRPVDTSNCH